MYSIQQYVIKFVIDLRQVGGLFRVFQFPPPIKLNQPDDKISLASIVQYTFKPGKKITKLNYLRCC
jgi:hypothetical protein